MRLKQLRKIFKKSTLLEADQVPRLTSKMKPFVTSLQLKVVNVSIVISSSISYVGRGPRLASCKYEISRKFLQSIKLYRGNL